MLWTAAEPNTNLRIEPRANVCVCPIGQATLGLASVALLAVVVLCHWCFYDDMMNVANVKVPGIWCSASVLVAL